MSAASGPPGWRRALYERSLEPSPLRDRVWEHVTRFLHPYLGLTAESKVLELGCGAGSWIRAIPAGERHALDANPDLAELLRRQGIAGVTPHVGTCTDLSRWGAGSLDLALASNLLEHLLLDEALACVAEVRRVLRPGGRFCVVQPNFATCPDRYFDDLTHRTVFTHVSLGDALAAAGLRVVRAWPRFLPYSMRGAPPWVAGLVPWYLRSPWKPRAGQMCLLSAKDGDRDLVGR